MYFPQGSTGTLSLEAGVAAAADVAKSAGKSELAVFTCVEADVCRTAQRLSDGWAKKYGLTMTYKGQV